MLAALLVSAFSTVPLQAEEAWEVHVESYFHHTTDAALFSASRRLSHDQDPTLPVVESEYDPQRSDFVFEPEMQIYRHFDNVFGHGKLGLVAEGFIFLQESRFTHPMVGVHFINDLPFDNQLILRYTFIPDLHIGRNPVRPLPESEAGDELLRLADEEVTTHFWSLGIGHQFNPQVHGRIYSRYGLRRYERPFQHRDNHFWTVGAHLEIEPAEDVEILLGYHFERAYADGRHRPELRDDVSYRNHYVTGEILFGLTESLALEIGGHYERNGWTSSVAGDIRRGEYEDIVQGEIALFYNLTARLSLTAEFQGVHRKESFEDQGLTSYNASVGVQWHL